MASATVTMAIGAHVAAGASMPAAWIVAAMLAAAAPLCWALSAHRWSVSELVGVFLLAQTAVHLLTMATERAGSPAMDMSGPLGLSPAMVTSHVLGAALLVLLVRRGEAALWAVVDVLALRVVALLVPVSIVGPTLRSKIFVRLLRPVSRPWLTVAVDRGPPFGVVSHELA